jgi:hypothetical protein
MKCRLSPERAKTALDEQSARKSPFGNLLAFTLFTRLIGNAAGRFAGGLAGSLALAAAALFQALR